MALVYGKLTEIVIVKWLRIMTISNERMYFVSSQGEPLISKKKTKHNRLMLRCDQETVKDYIL